MRLRAWLHRLLLHWDCQGGRQVVSEHHGPIKRVTAAVGEGSTAVRYIHQYLAEIGAPND